MVAIPVSDPSLDKVDAATVEVAKLKPRKVPFLGASSIGHACERKIWLDWRMAKREEFTAEQIYRFEDGYAVESIMASRLARAGFKIKTINPDTGYQFGLELVDGHLRGRIDGIIEGLIQAPTTPHIWEAKSANEKKCAELIKAKAEHGEKAALKAWDFSYYSQAVIYMHAMKLTRHYLTCSSPGARTTASVRTNADPDFAQGIIEKATRIKNNPHLPQGLSSDPTWYQCKCCTFHSLCFENKVADVNCRTCLHATPASGGEWHCAKYNQNVPSNFQVQGCDNHLFVPTLILYAKAVDANEEANTVTYEKADGVTFVNGKGFYTSKELNAAQDFNAIGDVGVDTIKSIFGAEVVG